MNIFQIAIIIAAFIIPISLMMALKVKHKKYYLIFSPIVFWPLTVGSALSFMTAVAISSENFTIDNICFDSGCFDYSLRTLAPAWMILVGTLAITGIAISTVRHDEVIAGKAFNERKQEIELFFKLREEVKKIFESLDSYNALKKGLITDYGRMFNVLFPNFRYQIGLGVSKWQDHLYSTNDALSDITIEEIEYHLIENDDEKGLSLNPKIKNAQNLVISLASLISEHTEYDSWGNNVIAKTSNDKEESALLFEFGISLFKALAESGVFKLDSSAIEHVISTARKIRPREQDLF